MQPTSFIRALGTTALLALALNAAAAGATPVGLWKTLDDDGQQALSWVRITEAGGVYSGRIERVLAADVKPGEVCEACTDERKNQPIVGLLLIRDVKQNAADPTTFDGGDILDPDDGKVYRVRLRLEAGGSRLAVRGYFGPFYRTQNWIRLQ